MKLFKLTNYLLLAIITLVTSCANNEKKVMILVKGNVTVDESAKTIVVKDGVGNTEKEMTFNSQKGMQYSSEGEIQKHSQKEVKLNSAEKSKLF